MEFQWLEILGHVAPGMDFPNPWPQPTIPATPYPLEVQAWPIVYRGQPAVQGILCNVTLEAETERLRKGLLAATKEILSPSQGEEVLRGVANAGVFGSLGRGTRLSDGGIAPP